MKYDNHRKFRFELVRLLKRSRISQSPLREDFISLSWRKYKSHDSTTILFDSSFERAKYEKIKKNMIKQITWGAYLYLMTDGNLPKIITNKY